MSHQTLRGRLKIFFGYAPGVGKTHHMLEEAVELRARGSDVCIGFLEIHGPGSLLLKTAGLETVARKRIAYRAETAEELDVDAVIKRHPQVCIVDELAHSNVQGSVHQKRWQDVEAICGAGIDVLTTMNVQDLASLGDQIWQLTGMRIRETVPDWFFQAAEEVLVVDVTPRALLHRHERGDIHSQERAKSGAERLFQEPVLVALRELAIRQTAQALEARRATSIAHAPDSERILVHLTPGPSTALLLRRARRVADFLHAACFGVCVYPNSHSSSASALERQGMERHLRFAESLHIETQVVQGRDQPRALVDFARLQGATRIFLSRPPAKRNSFARPDFADRVIELAPDLEITIVSEHTSDQGAVFTYPEDEAGSLMHSGYIRLAPEMTAEEANAEIRRQAGHVEMIYYAYIIDELRHLLGVVSLLELLSAEKNKKVREIMHTNYVSVQEDTQKETVAHLLAIHRLLAIPVLDQEAHMGGIIAAADLAGMVQLESGRDIQKIGGMEALDGPYLDVTFGQMVRKRAGWLAILFVGEMLTATAMGYFSDEISRAVVLALFLPLIISSGGNSGSQATTLVIRAMAMGELRLRDWWRVVRRELSAGLALGSILGFIGVTRILAWQALRQTYGPHYQVIAATIGCSLVGVVMFGTLAGSMLPFVLRRCGLDPASASAPFVATLVDVTGLIIYFSIANIILRGTLL